MTVQVSFEVHEYLSYAMAHNGIPVVTGIRLLNQGPSMHGATVRVVIRDGSGQVSLPWSIRADLVSGQPILLDEVPVHLDPDAMFQVSDEQPTRVIVRVEHEGDEVGGAVRQTQLLPGNHWRSLPAGLALEMLSAFVQPNDPAIQALLVDASAILEHETGSASLEGYQSGTDRADAIAEAVWRAAQARGIRYAEPPSSWGSVGQKVRTPTMVLEGGIGTCLDTTVVLAAALEQAGLRPLIWVLEGHAFLGYWRDEVALDAIVYGEGAEAANEVDRGRMRLLETTVVTRQEEPVSFDDAHRLALAKIHDLSKVVGIIDVWVARQSRIFPLPARRPTTDGGVQVFEYAPRGERERTIVIDRPGARNDERAGAPVPPRVQGWKNSLLDLTLRNRLINYTDKAGVKIVVPEGRLGAIEDLVSAGRPLTLRPGDAVAAIHAARGAGSAARLSREDLDANLLDKFSLFAEVTTAGYQTRMRGLAYKARTIVEETGANNLYLALGSVVWRIDNKPLRSPLVLVPVRLVPTARGGAYRIELDETGASTPNYCLLEKLREVHGLEIPRLANPESDDSGIDLDGVLAAVRDAIAEKGLPFRVEPTADLSILQFAKFRLWKDLDENWELLTQNSLVNHLVHAAAGAEFEDPTPPILDLDLDALQAACPVPADASQLSAVAEAVGGRTFVLEGPPGTGKSQTITNLLTRAVAEGKRVLFVAEKRAALDVVQARLNSVGMGDFSLDLHDRGSKPAVVRGQIRAAMEHVAVVDEQGLAVQGADLEQSRKALARYVARLHEVNGRGLSYYTARTKLLALGVDGPTFTVPSTLLSPQADEQVRAMVLACSSLDDVAEPARPSPDHPWGFVRDGGFDGDRVRDVRVAARQVEAAVSGLPTEGRLCQAIDRATSPGQLRRVAVLAQEASLDLHLLDEARTPGWRDATDRVAADVGAFLTAAHPGLDAVTPAALDLPLADIHARAQAAAASGFFGRKKRLRAVLTELQPALRANAVVPPKEVPVLTAALLQVQGAVRGLAQQATQIPGLQVPSSWNPLTEEGRGLVDRQVQWLRRLSDCVPESDLTDEFSRSLRAWLSSGEGASSVDAADVEALATGWESLAVLSGVTDASLTTWLQGEGLVPRWRATSSGRGIDEDTPLALTRWLAFDAALAPFEAADMREAADLLRLGRVDALEAGRALERGIARASIVERERTTGLDTFDPVGHERSINRFVTSSSAVRAELRNAVPAAVVESRSFDATLSIGQVGELQRELAKQRRALGVRGLMERYGDLITQLMPCVLVSPDSVARFFPVGSLEFDLVVFDEASQIRVADAVGAMGRARSVVVVGDSKQMPPTSFGESALADEDETSGEEVVVEDGESILTEAVSSRVPQRWLTWHYRSQDESLIAFSNVKYYEGKLSSFPAPSSPNEDRLTAGRGISLVRVDGHFRRNEKGKLLRTNPEEAAAIVADLEARFASSPDAIPSVGVVTFNLQQRTYIEGLIRDSDNDRMLQALEERDGEGLFVKNLENVQGDERDVILFSTAFSANDKGVLPLNFGPLTRAGGERRLNVAVTRARRQVVLYSSFAPGDLRVGETQSVGVKHLHAYLELADRGPDTWAAGSAAVRTRQDRHRDDVAEALRARGLTVTTDVGLSDFRIDLTLASGEDPDVPLVAVLLDGSEWAARRTVSDRDGLPTQVLRDMMRWPAVERVWMPAWVDRREEVLDHLCEVVRSAPEPRRRMMTAPVAVPAPPAGLSAIDSASLETSYDHAAEPNATAADEQRRETHTELRAVRTPAPRLLPGQEEFQPFVATYRGPRSVLDELPLPDARAKVRRVLQKVVETEGPVHTERLVRHVAACFDLTRVNAARASAILSALPSGLNVQRDEPFVWPGGLIPSDWQGFRTSGGEDRSFEHVSLREIGNAMVALCRQAAGASADELDSSTLALFGGRRRTAGIAARLTAARERAVHESRLVVAFNGMHRAAE